MSGSYLTPTKKRRVPNFELPDTNVIYKHRKTYKNSTPLVLPRFTEEEIASAKRPTNKSLPFASQNVMSQAGLPIINFLDAHSQARLRETSFHLRNNVSKYSKGSKDTIIQGPLERWRRAHPNAKYANISGRDDITDADFVYLRGIKVLNMRWCTGVTDAAFVHLREIHTLNISHCSQITDAAFVHLRGIKVLNMSWCDRITDAAFVHLENIHTLDMSHCTQAGITDAAFVHLKGIHRLSMRSCDQDTITGATLNELGTKIQYLDISYCNDNTERRAAELYGVTYHHPTVRRPHGGRKTRKEKNKKALASPSKG